MLSQGQLVLGVVFGLSVLQWFGALLPALASLILAVGLTLHPNFRRLVDSGLSPKTVSEPVVTSSRQKDGTPVGNSSFAGSNSDITQLAVPYQLEQPLDVLLNLIIRDFIDNWYTQSISLGDRRFPAQARSILNGLVNALANRVEALNAKEAGIYLLHSFSNALVSDLKEQRNPVHDEVKKHKHQEMIAKLRAVAEELLLVAAPPAASSPAFIALLTEVLTLGLWKTITAMDADFLNLTIVGRSEMRAATTSKSVRRRSFGPLVDLASSPPHGQTSFSSTIPQAKEQVDSPALPTPLEAGPPDMRQALDVLAKGPPELAANLLQQIELYLAEHPREIEDTSKTPSVKILHHVLTGHNEELADSFQDYIDTLESDQRMQGTALMRSHSQLESFKKVSDMSGSNEEDVRKDCIAVLARICQSLYTSGLGQDCALQQVLASCVVSVAGLKPSPTGMNILEDWIANRLERDYFQIFMDGQQHSRPASRAASRHATPKSPRSLSPTRSSHDLHGSALDILPTLASALDASSPRASFSGSSRRSSVASHVGSFSEVTITDLSEPSAYDEKHHVIFRRNLLFLIAVETSDGTPSYILQRSYPELERMDVALSKPLLPAMTAKTSEKICSSLEEYLTNLLNSSRLSQSKPVTDFFQRERATANAPSKVDFADRDLDEIVAKMGDNALKGGKKLGKLASKGFSAFGNLLSEIVVNDPSPTPSPARQRDSLAAPNSRRGSVQSEIPSPTSSRRPSFAASSVAGLSRKPSSNHLKESSEADKSSEVSPFPSQASPISIKVVDSANNVKPEETLSDPSSVSTSHVLISASQDNLSNKPHSVSPKEPIQLSQTPLPKAISVTSKAEEISAADFEHLINSMLGVLNNAYRLTDGQWSLKRGIVKVIETVLRTSYQSPIKAAFAQLVNTADAETIAAKIEELQESFWPDGVYHEPMAERSKEEKEATRLKARDIFTAQAPEGLKLALGATATLEAFGRIHDSLQGDGITSLVYTVLLDFLRLLLL